MIFRCMIVHRRLIADRHVPWFLSGLIIVPGMHCMFWRCCVSSLSVSALICPPVLFLRQVCARHILRSDASVATPQCGWGGKHADDSVGKPYRIKICAHGKEMRTDNTCHLAANRFVWMRFRRQIFGLGTLVCVRGAVACTHAYAAHQLGHNDRHCPHVHPSCRVHSLYSLNYLLA